MSELLVIGGVIVVAVIVLLAWALCKISGESDDAMDKAMEERRVKTILLPGDRVWRKNPTLKPESKRKFEDVEPDNPEQK